MRADNSRTGGRRIEEIHDAGVWNTFVDTSANGLPLHHLDFLTMLTHNCRRELIPLGIIGSSGLEAIAPLVIEYRGPGGIFKIARNIDFYDGLVPPMAAGRVADHLDLIKQEARRNHIGLTLLSVVPDRPLNGSLIRLMRLCGYQIERGSSFVIPLQGRDTAFIRTFANRRLYRNMERAARCGLYVRDATGREMEETFPRLGRRAYETTGGKFPFAPGIFGEIFRQRCSDSRFSMRSACLRTPSGEEVVAGMGLMIDNGKIANFWKLATNEAFEYAQPSTALYWDAIRTAMAKGLKAVDTGTAPSAGIAEYKRQWGAIEVPYYRFRFVTTPAYRAIEQMRKIYRRATAPGGLPLVAALHLQTANLTL